MSAPDPSSVAVPYAAAATVAAVEGHATQAPPMLPSARTPKAEQTRAGIIDAALTLFRERGYDDTTMRAIGAAAGVSAGNTYYYFASKEQLILGFYERAGHEHRSVAEPALQGVGDLGERITIALETWIDVMAPYRAFAGKFFRNAAEPSSPLSPFSANSALARGRSIEMWGDVIAGATNPVPEAVRSELPALLWLYSMGVVLFWVHDGSTDASRTRTLARRTAPLLARAIEIAGLPMLRSTVEELMALAEELRHI